MVHSTYKCIESKSKLSAYVTLRKYPSGYYGKYNVYFIFLFSIEWVSQLIKHPYWEFYFRFNSLPCLSPM